MVTDKVSAVLTSESTMLTMGYPRARKAVSWLVSAKVASVIHMDNTRAHGKLCHGWCQDRAPIWFCYPWVARER